MVIALMGDAYSKVIDKQLVEDTRERLLLINKYQRFAIFARGSDPQLKYLHSIQDAYKDFNKKEYTHKKLKDLNLSMRKIHADFTAAQKESDD